MHCLSQQNMTTIKEKEHKLNKKEKRQHPLKKSRFGEKKKSTAIMESRNRKDQNKFYFGVIVSIDNYEG